MIPALVRSTARLAGRHRHVNWALADQAMISGVNFLTGILLARFLGIEEFGRFTLAWMVVLFAAAIQNAAINSPMMSIGSQQAEEDAPAYYGAVFAQQAVFTALSVVIVFAGTAAAARWFPQWNIDGLALPLAAAAAAYHTQDFLRRYFFTRGRPSAAFAADATCYLGRLALLVCLFFAFTGMDSHYALWAIAAMTAVATLCAAFLVEPLRWVPEVARSVTRRHGGFSKWLVLSRLTKWTSSQLFYIATGALLGAAAVGALRAARNLMGVTHILLMGLENIVPVRAAQHFQRGGVKALKEYLRRVSWIGGSVTAFVALAFAVAPGFWLDLFYGGSYAGYGYLIRWFAAVYILIFMELPLRAALRAIEQTQPIFSANLWASLFSLAAVYPLIHWFELYGVMAGLLITQVIVQATLWWALRSKMAQRTI